MLLINANMWFVLEILHFKITINLEKQIQIIIKKKPYFIALAIKIVLNLYFYLSYSFCFVSVKRYSSQVQIIGTNIYMIKNQIHFESTYETNYYFIITQPK